VTDTTWMLVRCLLAISRHLKSLAEAGILGRFREGAWAYYRIADRCQAGEVARWLVASCNVRDETRQRDLERLGEVRARRSREAQAYFEANAKSWSQIRSLHVDEALVEQQLAAMAPDSGGGEFLGCWGRRRGQSGTECAARRTAGRARYQPRHVDDGAPPGSPPPASVIAASARATSMRRPSKTRGSS